MQRLQSSLARVAAPHRGYFYAHPGESGIWGKTLKAYYDNLGKSIVVGVAFGIYVLWGPYSGDRQFAPYASDLYLDDGTELEGEEATANARIEYERIMPLMNELKQKFDE